MNQIKTFVISGILGVNLEPSYLDDEVNQWLKENPDIKIEKRMISTNTLSNEPGQKYQQHTVTICLVIFYTN